MNHGTRHTFFGVVFEQPSSSNWMLNWSLSGSSRSVSNLSSGRTDTRNILWCWAILVITMGYVQRVRFDMQFQTAMRSFGEMARWTLEKTFPSEIDNFSFRSSVRNVCRARSKTNVIQFRNSDDSCSLSSARLRLRSTAKRETRSMTRRRLTCSSSASNGKWHWP